MPERLVCHFEPRKGWMNDPNGLVFFKGRYHAFFQHYPYAPKWGQMHWGHAVSSDLIHWEEKPIALYPDQPYENSGGCYSGSAVVRDDVLYLMYTSVSRELGQTQSIAFSRDGVTFEKYGGNPVIRAFPVEGSADFRDPKVTLIGDTYHAVLGSGKDGVGKILRYTSRDLLAWDYAGVLYQGAEHGGVLECPDFFPLGERYVLMFSQMGRKTHATMFVTGDFDGDRFTPLSRQTPEAGPHFYAPQTFPAPDGRRILIAWLYAWGKPLDEGAEYAGALTIPRELALTGDKLTVNPAREARGLLSASDEHVLVDPDGVTVGETRVACAPRSVEILRDTKTVEVFVNGGETSITYWFGK